MVYRGERIEEVPVHSTENVPEVFRTIRVRILELDEERNVKNGFSSARCLAWLPLTQAKAKAGPVVYGGQQFFRHKPKDLKIQEGGEAVLECEISMLQGEVQWTKNGFALVPLQNCVPEPHSPQIKPGFPVQLPEDTLKTPAPVPV
ncbi:hypothetical protein RUM44_003513 [Polyplax serrata]|uniref:Ig-like domain-containing protein n=1 Tax=Polyplax serrata TaxID=468196 RepID=A0ABR1AGN7_POLSC